MDGAADDRKAFGSPSIDDLACVSTTDVSSLDVRMMHCPDHLARLLNLDNAVAVGGMRVVRHDEW